MKETFPRDLQYAKFSAYGFLKNLRFFEPFMILFLLGQGLSYLQVGTLYAANAVDRVGDGRRLLDLLLAG
ncbi:MAG: hypothetical protein R6W94_00755, partial [Spirochaetia bacterium]